jgi:hypothetical protein
VVGCVQLGSVGTNGGQLGQVKVRVAKRGQVGTYKRSSGVYRELLDVVIFNLIIFG